MQPNDTNSTEQKMLEMDTKINAIYVSVEKTRKYFLWTMIGTIVMFVLPLIAIAFVVPSFISSYTSTLQGI